jgi:energy-coupling factor transporter ATP-binding protein EcfA2
MANSLATIMGRMQDLENQTVERKLFTVLYGPFGTGKTILAAGLAQKLMKQFGGRTLYLDSSDGWVSLDIWNGALKKGVTRYELSDSHDLAVIAGGLKSRTGKLKDVTVLIIDELSSIAEDVLENVVRDRAGVLKGVDLPEVEGKDYGPMTAIIGSIMRDLKRVPNLHVIVIAHDREQTLKNQSVMHRPSFSPLLNTAVQKVTHVTGYLSNEIQNHAGKITYVRQIQSQPSALVAAKSRITDMPLKVDSVEWVNRINDWVASEEFLEDISGTEPAVEVYDDSEDVIEEDQGTDEPDPDDAPAYVGPTE